MNAGSPAAMLKGSEAAAAKGLGDDRSSAAALAAASQLERTGMAFSISRLTLGCCEGCCCWLMASQAEGDEGAEDGTASPSSTAFPFEELLPLAGMQRCRRCRRTTNAAATAAATTAAAPAAAIPAMAPADKLPLPLPACRLARSSRTYSTEPELSRQVLRFAGMPVVTAKPTGPTPGGLGQPGRSRHRGRKGQVGLSLAKSTARSARSQPHSPSSSPARPSPVHRLVCYRSATPGSSHCSRQRLRAGCAASQGCRARALRNGACGKDRQYNTAEHHEHLNSSLTDPPPLLSPGQRPCLTFFH